MATPVRLRRRRRGYALLAALAAAGVAIVAVRLDLTGGPPEVEGLIALMRLPANKPKVMDYIVPGGEMIEYSWPMRRLIELGDVAREPLHRRLRDGSIRNGAALVLGAVGDETTVPLLIEAFPESDASDTPFDGSDPDPDRLSVICFAHALNRLTGQGIGQTRWGTEFGPDIRQRWLDWWARSSKTFCVRDDHPGPNRTLKTVPEVLARLD
ncbi:MAG TPA: hypothetical protein VH120_06850, partial [Gemmataceae bacterium]|nr:hypothetical protein [Gemmataceae bacterium]